MDSAMNLDKKPFHQIVPQVEEVARLIETIVDVAPSRLPVLIFGPRSPAVDLIAQAIHMCSPRSARPFATVRCSTSHDTLHNCRISANGGAGNMRRGSTLEAAIGGTLFIDQIHGASPALQLELLQLITEQEFVDATRGEVQQTDMRVVLSAWLGLDRRAQQGEFRKELYDRISMVTMEVRRGASSREWFFDVAMMLREVVLAKENCSNLPAGLVVQINRYSWSPQVRVLEDAIRSIVLRGQDSSDPETMFFEVLRTIGQRRAHDWARRNLQAVSSAVERCADMYEFFEGHMYETLIGQIQKTLIRKALKQCNGVISRAAGILGMNANLLETKVRELGLQ
jgi:DNA-binding NtrC family response regulator